MSECYLKPILQLPTLNKLDFIRLSFFFKSNVKYTLFRCICNVKLESQRAFSLVRNVNLMLNEISVILNGVFENSF